MTRPPERRGTLRDARQQPPAGQPRGEGPGTAVARSKDPARNVLISMQGEFAKALPTTLPSEAFVRQALTGMKASAQADKLTRILLDPRHQMSMFVALMNAARAGLMPFTEEGTIVPFGNVATFIPMWKGLVKQFYNSGQVADVQVRLIARRDEWDEGYGSGGRFHHKPTRFEVDGVTPLARGTAENPWILAYCYVALTNGGGTFHITDKLEADDIMVNHSRQWQYEEQLWRESGGKRGRKSMWHTNYPAMWRKCPARRVLAPKSADVVDLFRIDRDDLAVPLGQPADEFEESIWEGEVVGEDNGTGPAETGIGWLAEPAPDDGADGHQEDLDRVLTTVKAHPGITTAKLAAEARISSAKTALALIRELEDEGQVERGRDGRSTTWTAPVPPPGGPATDGQQAMVADLFGQVGVHTPGDRQRAERAILGHVPGELGAEEAETLAAALRQCLENATPDRAAVENLWTICRAAESTASERDSDQDPERAGHPG